MYPECRHVKPSGRLCNSPALSGSNWCYFHKRLHERQAALNAAQVEAFARSRTLDGRFIPAPQSSTVLADSSGGAGQMLHCGIVPIPDAGRPITPEQMPLDLPPIEDAASIQLALIDVTQALAANRIDPRRASLLLYALQVASANTKQLDLPSTGVRSLTYTTDGLALAPQEYGWDIEDIEEEIEREDREAAGDDEQDEDEG
jgi:hypothetical protein